MRPPSLSRLIAAAAAAARAAAAAVPGVVVALMLAAPALAQQASTPAPGQIAPDTRVQSGDQPAIGPPAAAQTGANDQTGPAAAAPPPAAGEPSELPKIAEREIQGPTPGPAYDEWEKVARRAETALEEARASNAAFEQLRGELVIWRGTFQSAQSANQTRIDTLKAQIAALGPVPADGTPEATDLAARRSELQSQLARLEAPRRAADEAFSRADNLIREIDATIRERQANALLKLGPSPLNPKNWPIALSALTGTLGAIGKETAAAVHNRLQMADARAHLPLTLAYLLLALLLVLRAPRWLGRIETHLAAGRSSQVSGLIGFLSSLTQVVAVVAGFALIQAAVESSNLTGYRGDVLVGTIGSLGFFVAVAAWLGANIFPRGEDGNEVLGLPPERRREGRLFSTVLGALIWSIVVIRSLSDFESYLDEARAVLQFPVLLVAGLCLVRLGQLIGHRRPDEDEAQQSSVFRLRLARVTGRFIMVFGVIGPALAAIGYQSAASFLTFPTAVTLALLAMLVLLQSVITRIYGLVTRKTETEVKEALAPVLVGMVLTLLSLPLFALVWGARVADLTELWTRFRDGYAVGGTRISPAMFLTFLVVFAIGFGITRLVQGTLRASVLPKTRIDPGGQTAIVSGVGYIGIFIAGAVRHHLDRHLAVVAGLRRRRADPWHRLRAAEHRLELRRRHHHADRAADRRRRLDRGRRPYRASSRTSRCARPGSRPSTRPMSSCRTPISSRAR